jgi:O-antigen/teichoic acid export membrane protein
MKIRGTGTLGLSQALALAAALGAGTAYATWLTPAELAVWAIALGAGRAAQLLVDGGLKAALVRHALGLQAKAEAQLTRAVLLAAAVLSMATAVAAGRAAGQGYATAPVASLVALAIIGYLMSHAAALTALARLERSGRFDHIGRVEGAGTLLEFAVPALLLAVRVDWSWALAIGLLSGRLVRALGLLLAAGPPRVLPPDEGLPVAPWRDGLAMQSIAALGMLRDQVHLWLVGPLYGTAWAGAYAFALMACALASQVAVGTVARVAMPALRPLQPRRRALRAARSMRLLALWTLPLLLLSWPVMQWADRALWDGQWQLAITLLPGLLLRMVGALPLAVLGPWLAVSAPPWAAAKTHARWTVAELVLCGAAVAAWGPAGLAFAWAAGGLLGTVVFLAALKGAGVGLFLGALARVPVRGRRRWSMSTCC